MIRRAFTMRLKPGAMAEYRKHHDEIWPDLVKKIEEEGIAHISTFEADPVLFLFSEITDLEAWNRLWTSEVHRRWGEVMEPLMHFRDGVVDFGELREIFHLETPAGRPQAGPATKRPAKKAAARGGAKKSAGGSRARSAKKAARKATSKKTTKKTGARGRGGRR